MRIKYSRELLAPLVQESISVAEVIRKLGLKQAGGAHSHISSKIKKYGIDTSHFLGRASNHGANHKGGPDKLSPEEVLVFDRVGGRRESVQRLRRALLESGVEHKCEVCGLLPEWNGKYLQLQIDHRNGIFYDNRIENLRFICGNCHLQTETFGTLNATAYRLKLNEVPDIVEEIIEELTLDHIPNPNWRTEPRLNQRKVERPSKEDLERLLWEKPTAQLAIDFGVSDKAIEKWAKLYGLTKPSRGYWAKLSKK